MKAYKVKIGQNGEFIITHVEGNTVTCKKGWIIVLAKSAYDAIRIARNHVKDA